MRNLIIPFSLLIFLSNTSFAQKVLVFQFQKTEKIYRIREEITFFVRDGGRDTGDEGNKKNGKITAINDTSISIDGEEFSLKEIKSIIIYRPLLKMAHEVLWKAGVGFFFVDIFSRAINYELPIFEKRTIVTSSALVAGGLILLPFIKKEYVIDEKARIKIMVL